MVKIIYFVLFVIFVIALRVQSGNVPANQVGKFQTTGAYMNLEGTSTLQLGN